MVDQLLSSWILFAQPAQRGPMDSLITFLPFIFIGVLFYFMLIRPERRKRAELNQMLANLKKNDRVVTVGGIYGTVFNVQKDSEYVTVKVDEASNTKLRMLRSSISRVVTEEETGEKKEAG